MMAMCRGMIFVISQSIIVSARVGPTLTIVSFAPVNPEIRLRYSRAAFGRLDHFRADRVDLFQPGILS